MFAASGKAGPRQQHDWRLRPAGPGHDKTFGLKARMGATGHPKQHVQFAVQEFGKIVGDLEPAISLPVAA